MKHLLLVLALLSCTSFALGQGSIQMINTSELTPETHVAFISVVNHTTITIESEYGIVTEMELPKGVSYSVEVLKKDHPWVEEDPFRQVIEGDVVIRIRREEGIEIGRDMWDVMQESPFQLALENVKVTITDHVEPGRPYPNN